jgi:hypothetical protein
MSSSEENQGYLPSIKSVIQILSGTRTPRSVSMLVDGEITQAGENTQASDFLEETEKELYVKEALRNNDAMRISEEKVTETLPDTSEDFDECHEGPILSTGIPDPFSQNDSRDHRPLSIMLRATSGRGGAVSRQFFPSSDFAPLSAMNRSAYGTEHSARFRDVDPRDNVTRRETKRPQERPRDKEYRRRFSTSSSVFAESEPRGGQPWPHANENDQRASVVTVKRGGTPFQQSPSRSVRPHQPTPFRSVPSPLKSNLQGGMDTPFSITLVYEGESVDHRVWATMPITQLIREAADIFGLDLHTILLVLVTGISNPTPIPQHVTIEGPPRVGPNSTVMVLALPGDHGHHYPDVIVPFVDRSYPPRSVPVQMSLPPALNSKLLSSFKLPKFDGAARNWKVWDRAFQRFLGLHQLDYVLDEDFPTRLWSDPGAKESNKLVFFLLEDAVAVGSLASKYVRQAAKWDGHGAYLLLHNGYVFSGPQTATILLAELSSLRLLRDENASVFCLRLVELVEDLEMIPGDAAVFLTETQKLGYLLSAIRHEPTLQSVYAQLQSDQLRGRVSFEEACRELHFRVEAMRADDFMDSRIGKALISTTQKKNGKGATRADAVMAPCLSKICSELVIEYMPLCKGCYLQCIAGKLPSIELRDNLGRASYNATTRRIDYPSSVPASRLPKAGMKKGRKALVGRTTDVSPLAASRESEDLPLCSTHN